MSLIRGRIWPEREIRQKIITFGKMPENLRQCQCGCEKWFDTSSGKPVEIKVQTFDELMNEVPLCEVKP